MGEIVAKLDESHRASEVPIELRIMLDELSIQDDLQVLKAYLKSLEAAPRPATLIGSWVSVLFSGTREFFIY